MACLCRAWSWRVSSAHPHRPCYPQPRGKAPAAVGKHYELIEFYDDTSTTLDPPRAPAQTLPAQHQSQELPLERPPRGAALNQTDMQPDEGRRGGPGGEAASSPRQVEAALHSTPPEEAERAEDAKQVLAAPAAPEQQRATPPAPAAPPPPAAPQSQQPGQQQAPLGTALAPATTEIEPSINAGTAQPVRSNLAAVQQLHGGAKTEQVGGSRGGADAEADAAAGEPALPWRLRSPVMHIARGSDVRACAGALASRLRRSARLTVCTIGEDALHVALKAAATARDMLLERDGLDVALQLADRPQTAAKAALPAFHLFMYRVPPNAWIPVHALRYEAEARLHRVVSTTDGMQLKQALVERYLGSSGSRAVSGDGGDGCGDVGTNRASNGGGSDGGGSGAEDDSGDIDGNGISGRGHGAAGGGVSTTGRSGGGDAAWRGRAPADGAWGAVRAAGPHAMLAASQALMHFRRALKQRVPGQDLVVVPAWLSVAPGAGAGAGDKSGRKGRDQAAAAAATARPAAGSETATAQAVNALIRNALAPSTSSSSSTPSPSSPAAAGSPIEASSGTSGAHKLVELHFMSVAEGWLDSDEGDEDEDDD